MFDNIDEQVQNKPGFFNEDAVKADFEKALEVLCKVSPSNCEVSYYSKLVVERLQEYKSINVLLNLLIMSEGDNAKCSLIINFISHYLRSQVRPTLGISRHDKKAIYQKIKKMFFCNTLTEEHKKMLQTSFSNFLSTLSSQFCKMRKNLCEEIIEFYTNNQNPTPMQLNNILYLIDSVLNSNLQTESLRILQEKLLFNFVKLSLNLTKQIDDIITNTVHYTEEQKYMINWALKIQKTTELFFINAKPDKLFMLKLNVITSNQLTTLITLSLKLSKNRNQLTLDPSSCSEYEAINEIKLSTLFIFKDALTLLQKIKKNLTDPKYIPIIQTSKQYLKEIVPILINEIREFPKKKIISQTIFRQALCILAKIIAIPSLLSQLTELRDLVLFRICLPCFITTEEDKKLSAEDFCNQKQRTVDYESIINIHQAAAQVVESYCDHIYGSTPHLVKSLINFMEFQLTADPRLYEQVPNILIQSPFVQDYTYFEQIDAGLSIMALLSYQADNREDIAVLFQQFIVRRQQFFSRIDVPVQLIISFLHASTYYQSNFYSMILEGKANSDFHRSLIFHTLELLNASFNPNTRDFISKDFKKIGIQALDYISNAVGQQYLFSAIFPAHNPQSTPLLLKLISKICVYLNSSTNINVIENILIDFFTKCIERHYEQKNNYINAPQPMRKQIGILVVEEIIKMFTPNLGLKNQSIAKQKLMQLYSLCVIISENPTQLLEIGDGLFNHIVDTQYAYIDEGLDVIQIYIQRVFKESIIIPPTLQNTIMKFVLKAMKICHNEKFQNEVFDIVLNLNLLKLFQQQITECLLEIFIERLQQKDSDNQAQFIMQKALYLLMQIAFSNFNLVASHTWIRVLEKMIDYMRLNYVMQDTFTIGKATCICLCCYIQNPNGVQDYLQSRTQGLWDCILDDQLKYSSVTQKKVICFLLLKLLMQYSSWPKIKDKFSNILKTICLIVYYIYEKDQMAFGQNESEDSMDEEKNKSDHYAQNQQKWKEPLNTMRANPFLAGLLDERLLLKEICLKVNEANHQNFQNFVNNLPIGLQNMVKNKIILYKNGGAAKKKMRLIYKIKTPSEAQ